jgi:hypothetical protein
MNATDKSNQMEVLKLQPGVELSSVSSSAVSSPQIAAAVIPSIPDHLAIKCNSICFGSNTTFYPQPTCAIKLFDVYWQIHVSEEGTGDNCITFTYSIIDQLSYRLHNEEDGMTVPESEKQVLELRVVVPQYLTRFDETNTPFKFWYSTQFRFGKELLNPEQDQASILFRFGQGVTLHSLKSYFGNGIIDFAPASKTT